MAEKFIRTAAPLTLGVVLAFDAVSAALTIAACVYLWSGISFISVAFVAIMAVVLFAAAAATRNTLQNGVRFYENRLEFTATDNENVFSYDEIERVEVYRDSHPSLKKSYTQRYSNVILYMTDGTVATVELGATTKRKLQTVEKEILKRINETTHR